MSDNHRFNGPELWIAVFYIGKYVVECAEVSRS